MDLPVANDNLTADFSYIISDNGTTNGVADPLSAHALATLDLAALGNDFVQVLNLRSAGETRIRDGHELLASLAYEVQDGNKQLTGISPSLFFDSSQVSIDLVGDPYQPSLLGYSITADTSDDDENPETDSILALSYTDFLGNFPGPFVSLPLTLAELIITPNSSYTGTTLTLNGEGAIGYEVMGDSLALGYDAAPSVANPIPTLSTDALNPWSYTLPADLFLDPDSDLTISIDSALPSWLSYDPLTTTFSGTPASSSDSLSIELSAADALGNISTAFNLNVRDVQQISLPDHIVPYQGGSNFTLPLIYSTTDHQDSTGLSFQLHYDSSLFSFVSITDPISEILGFSTAPDTSDADNNPHTDTVLNVAVSSFTGSLAPQALC